MRTANCWLCCQRDFHELTLDCAGAIETEFVNVEQHEAGPAFQSAMSEAPSKARTMRKPEPEAGEYWPLLQALSTRWSEDLICASA